MRIRAQGSRPDTPERLVVRLRQRLRRQALWDVLLVLLPPLIAAVYCVAYLYRGTWITRDAFLLAAAAAAALALSAVMYGYRRAVPSLALAAGLIDQQADASDRFITLSTVAAGSSAPALLRRLRAEATAFLHRVRLKRDFPYRIKRSFYQSLAASLLLGAAFHLLLPSALPRTAPAIVSARLRELAGKMEQRPNTAELGRQLKQLADKLQNPNVPPPEKERAIEEMRKKIEDQQKNEPQDQSHNLLGEAASALGGTEQKPGNGEQQKKDQQNGNGGVQSNIPQKGEGAGSAESGGAKNQVAGELSKGAQQGKLTEGDPKQEQAKNGQKTGAGTGDGPDPSRADRDQSKDTSGKTQGDREDKMGKDKASEDIPQGSPPAERLTRPGEQGNTGIKGARYVTVQLPEELTADSQAGSSAGKNRKGNRVGASVPVSNTPLPAHVPDAPTEKQHVPLEYRGLIH